MEKAPGKGHDQDAGLAARLTSAGSRREFLRLATVGGAAMALPFAFGACAPERTAGPLAGAANLHVGQQADDHGNEHGNEHAVVIRFTDDIGVLNYAYALEQLEAAFYTQVIATPYHDMPEPERRMLTDVRDHEVAHRDFLAAALGAAKIPNLTPDFSAVDFNSRQSVLTIAQTFEDLGVSAYNGAAKYIQNTLYLVIAGKIVSVEGRHASAIRDRLFPRTGHFAPNAFDPAREPEEVLAAADPFIATPVTLVRS
jgi:hypothetical protein